MTICSSNKNKNLFLAFALLLVGSGLVPLLQCPSSQIWLGAPLLSVQRRLELCQHSLAGTDLWITYTAQRKPWTQRGVLKIKAAQIEPRSFNERKKKKQSVQPGLWADVQ